MSEPDVPILQRLRTWLRIMDDCGHTADTDMTGFACLRQKHIEAAVEEIERLDADNVKLRGMLAMTRAELEDEIDGKMMP